MLDVISLQVECSPGVWTDVSGDLVRDALRWRRGIFGAGPLDLLARPGSASFTLDNSDQNTAATAGYYTPGHASALAGWRQGIWVRLRLGYGAATRYVFRGRLRSIHPDPGVTGLRVVMCEATDWLTEFAEFDAGNLALQEHARSDELLEALIDSLPAGPANRSIDVGLDEYPFAFDDLGGDAPKAMQVAQDILQSERGYLYLRGDATDGETLRFENRQARSVEVVAASFTAADFENAPGVLDVPSDLDTSIVNDVEVQTVPRRVDAAATTILVRLDGPIKVLAGETVQVFVDYRDPSQEAVFVGGKDMQALAATTDWTANAHEDGTGADMTGDFDVTATYFGSRAMIACTNHAPAEGYVRGPGGGAGLQARGKGLYRYAPVTSHSADASSVALFGTHQLPSPLVMPYQDDRAVGQGVADFIAHIYSGLTPFPRRLQVASETGGALLTQAITRDIGDKIAITEAQTGLDGTPVFIHAIEQEIGLDGRVRTWWTLAPADMAALFIFDDPESGVFDRNTFGYL